ncbi:MAG: hypothetical protein J7L15_07555 [Clostridiales bacterium]|nr:hypothetical protein [Clostridiales bacterium]
MNIDEKYRVGELAERIYIEVSMFKESRIEMLELLKTKINEMIRWFYEDSKGSN